MNMLLLLAIVIAVPQIAFFVGKFASRQMEGARAAEFARFAEQAGVSFFPNVDATLESRIRQFRIFNLGRLRRFRNLIVAETDNCRISVFDYEYTTGATTSTNGTVSNSVKKHSQTIAVVESRFLNLPEFQLEPDCVFTRLNPLEVTSEVGPDSLIAELGSELARFPGKGLIPSQSVLEKLQAVFESGDIDFETHPEFSDSFHLKGPDEVAIRRLFSPSTLAFFEERRGLTVEAARDCFVCFRTDKCVAAAELLDFFDQARKIFVQLNTNHAAQ